MSTNLRRPAFELFIASFIVLFQELALIRWLPGQVRVLAYFPNLILISAFLGLGLGALRAGKSLVLLLWPSILLLLLLLAWIGSGVAFTQESASEHLWLLYYDLPHDAPLYGDVRPPIVMTFVLSALLFMPLGQYVATRLNTFQQAGKTLLGYVWDLCGSLCGVVCFSFFGFLQTPPLVWFGVFLILGSVLLLDRARQLLLYAVLALFCLGLVYKAEKATWYSPYYALSTGPWGTDPGVGILTNGSLHQVALDLDLDSPSDSQAILETRQGYHQPYRLMNHKPRRGLVLGAGTGNDVAVMIDEGVEQIDAVEIDPVILQLGRKFHPNQPYSSEKVRVFNTDARAFLNNATEKYDLIVFGTLDSMTQLSALSGVRLDNFVYTRQCLEAAKKLLTPDGALVLYFMVGTQFIDQRITSMLTEVFEQVPAINRYHYSLFNNIYMSGAPFQHIGGEQRSEAARKFLQSDLPRIPPATDNWPFLYLRQAGISPFYLSLIGIFLSISVVSLMVASKEMRASIWGLKGVDVEMFLFGAAFLLLETRSVTEMSLVWGATWLTSAVVFSAILGMILLATLLSNYRSFHVRHSFLFLFLSLLIAYVFPAEWTLQSDTLLKFGVSFLFVGIPIFFAGMCFAAIYKERTDSNRAFGWNLLGAVIGGLCEFSSMAFGFRALLLIALLIYFGAYIANLLKNRGAQTVATT